MPHRPGRLPTLTAPCRNTAQRHGSREQAACRHARFSNGSPMGSDLDSMQGTRRQSLILLVCIESRSDPTRRGRALRNSTGDFRTVREPCQSPTPSGYSRPGGAAAPASRSTCRLLPSPSVSNRRIANPSTPRAITRPMARSRPVACPGRGGGPRPASPDERPQRRRVRMLYLRRSRRSEHVEICLK